MNYLNERKKLEKKKIKILNEFKSRDMTRMILEHVVHDSKVKALVSTDGCRLCVLKSKYDERLADIPLNTETMTSLEADFPRIQNVIPDHNKLKKIRGIKIEKEHYIKWTKGFKKPPYLFLEIVNDEGKFTLEESDNVVAAFNASFFRFLADGSRYHIAYKNAKSPLLISLDGEYFDDFVMIMPILDWRG